MYQLLPIVVSTFLVVVLADQTASPKLLDLINSTPTLSTLSGLISNATDAQQFLASLQNTTCFLTSNSAYPPNNSAPAYKPPTSYPSYLPNSTFSAAAQPPTSFPWDGSPLLPSLQYACVRGVFPSASFGAQPNYISSNLMNASYIAQKTGATSLSFVPGGAPVELLLEGGKKKIITGLGWDYFTQTAIGPAPVGQKHKGSRQEAWIEEADLPFDGGLVHIVDDFLSIPLNLSTTLTALDIAEMQYAMQKDSSMIRIAEDAAVFTGIYADNGNWPLAESQNNQFSDKQMSDVIAYTQIHNATFYKSSFVPYGATVYTSGGPSLTLTRAGINLFIDQVRVDDMYFTQNGCAYIVAGNLLPSGVRPPSNSTARNVLRTSQAVSVS